MVSRQTASARVAKCQKRCRVLPPAASSGSRVFVGSALARFTNLNAMTTMPAGLHLSSDDTPGIRRRPHGKSFSYRNDNGQAASRLAEPERLAELAFPWPTATSGFSLRPQGICKLPDAMRGVEKIFVPPRMAGCSQLALGTQAPRHWRCSRIWEKQRSKRSRQLSPTSRLQKWHNCWVTPWRCAASLMFTLKCWRCCPRPKPCQCRGRQRSPNARPGWPRVNVGHGQL